MVREPIPPGLETEPTAQDVDATSPVTRFGTVVGAGVVAAILASLPAVLRVGEGGGAVRTMEVWGALSALLSPLAIAAVFVFRRARAGARLAAGGSGPLLAGAVLGWCALELAVLSAFGAVLRAKTHHAGLAGVTFAVFALVSGTAMALLVLRGARALARRDERLQRGALGVAAVAVFLELVLVGVQTAKAPELGTSMALVDLLAVAVATFFASTRALARVKALAAAGVPLAAIIFVLGLSTVRARPALQASVVKRAPVHAWLLGAMGSDEARPRER